MRDYHYQHVLLEKYRDSPGSFLRLHMDAFQGWLILALVGKELAFFWHYAGIHLHKCLHVKVLVSGLWPHGLMSVLHGWQTWNWDSVGQNGISANASAASHTMAQVLHCSSIFHYGNGRLLSVLFAEDCPDWHDWSFAVFSTSNVFFIKWIFFVFTSVTMETLSISIWKMEFTLGAGTNDIT